MIINSIKIELTEKRKFIDLFAGIDGLSAEFQKAYKKNSIRFSSAHPTNPVGGLCRC